MRDALLYLGKLKVAKDLARAHKRSPLHSQRQKLTYLPNLLCFWRICYRRRFGGHFNASDNTLERSGKQLLTLIKREAFVYAGRVKIGLCLR